MLSVFVLSLASTAVAPATPEERAIAFLSREVPLWPRENGCFSCHNNGDAARALYVAQARGRSVPEDALETTTAWLSKPASWDENRGDPRFSDKVLARIQFASALVDSLGSRRPAPRAALREAALRLSADQNEGGSWQLDDSNSIGSPATYGSILATVAALRVLKTAGTDFESYAARAKRFLKETEVKTVLDAGAVVLGLDGEGDEESARQRDRALGVIAKGEAPSGGWGPYVSSAPEVFDTSIVLLALSSLRSEDTRDSSTRGRAFLLGKQLPDGSFPETTRPPGQQSYAQYISTTGWATLALLATVELTDAR